MNDVLLLLPEGFELLEAAAFTDIWGWNLVAGHHSTKLVTTGPQQVITASFGHQIKPELLLDEVRSEDFSALALPGGFPRYGYFRSTGNEHMLQLIRDFAADDKPIAAVCTGSLVLGMAGILHNRRATTYQGENGRWMRQLAAYGALIADDSPCIDGNLITGSGPASAVPVALQLLQMLDGPQAAAAITAMMEWR